MSNEKQNLDRSDTEKLSAGFDSKYDSQLNRQKVDESIPVGIGAGTNELQSSAETLGSKKMDRSIMNRLSAGYNEVLPSDELRKKLDQNALD